MNHAEEIWKTLVRASVDKKHPWRVVGFSTAGEQGAQVRSVILRSVKPAENTLVFYTDQRSKKMADIAHDSRVSMLFWNARSNTQLRVCGIAVPETSELTVNRAWEHIPDYARKDYATLSAPGALLKPEGAVFAIESARSNFVVLNVKVNAMELLELKREGHVRFQCVVAENGQWARQDLVP